MQGQPERQQHPQSPPRPQYGGSVLPELQRDQQPRMQQVQPRRRRRPALSCRECRRRKIRCDQKNPCAHCVRHKTHCTYQVYRDESEPSVPIRRQRARAPAPTASTPSISGFDLSPSSSHSVAQVQGHRQLSPAAIDRQSHCGLESTPHYQAPSTQSATEAAVHGVPVPVSGACDGHGHDFQNLLKRVQDLEESARSERVERTAVRSPPPEDDPETLKHRQKDGSHDWHVVLNKPRDLGKINWTDSTQEFASIITCWGELMGKSSGNPSFQEPETATLVAQAGDFLEKCKTTARSIKLVRPTRGLSSSSDFLAPPPREMSDTFADCYFKSFESTHRILHVPTFWADYQRYWDHLETVTADLRLIVLLVIGIGSSLFDHGGQESTLLNMELVHHWIYAAETWLAGPLEKDRVGITGLQIYCLTILARQIFSIGGDTVWMSMGSLIHRAMQVGLHRDPAAFTGLPMSALQAEVRRRLWATILELVVQASLDSRMPPRISFDEFDTKPPLNINDSEIDESTTVIQSHPKGFFTTTSIQLALLDSLPVRLQIVQLLNRIGTGISYQRTLELSAELINALQKNSTFMRNSQGCTSFHRNLLDYLVRRFIIPLHYDFSQQARNLPIYYYSAKLSLDTALAIMSPERDAAFSRLVASGGGLFREGIRVATTAISLELLMHVQAQHLDGTLQRTAQYRKLLKQAVRDLISLSEQRIHQGETNVKSHMFLSMILAQVEAIEANLPVELQIARSARDSLEYCYGILRARAEKMSLTPTPDEEPAAASVDVNQGLDGYGLDLNWESFLPDQAFFNGMTA